MKRLLFLLLLVPEIAQAQFTLSATDIANSNIRIPIRLVDVTDGETPETGLTPTCTRSINGAAKATCTGTITEIGTGDYYFTPAAAEYVAGVHVITVSHANADTFTATYRVSSGVSDLDFTDLTAQSGTSSTIQLAATETYGDDTINGRAVCISSGVGGGQCRRITAYVSATDTATISPNWTVLPDSTSKYYLRDLASINVASMATNVVDQILDDDTTEVTAVPGTGTVTFRTLLREIYQAQFHKFGSTSGEQIYYRADGSTKWYEKDIADDATTYSRDASETAD